MDKKIPDTVKVILSVLEKAGHQAYIVGGAVRDLLRGVEPYDYDITTSARPEQVLDCAKSQRWQVVDNLGQNFGVVMLIINGQTFEVTTFRGERYGEDSHRPEQVWFADSLETDLARRDFTINAMAMDAGGDIVDLFGGRRDLTNKIIRAVGDAKLRFKEDSLRMFRACRFAGQLGFRIENGTLSAMQDNLQRVAGLSLERVRSELEKMLLAEYCQISLAYFVETGLNQCYCRIKEKGQCSSVPILPELTHLVNLPQNSAYHKYDGWNHTLAACSNVPADLLLRWAALLHDIGKGLPGVRGMKDGQPTDYRHDAAGAQLAQVILTRLQMKPKFVKLAVWLVARHMKFYFYLNNNQSAVKRWLREEARLGAFRSRRELQKAFDLLTIVCVADNAATGFGSTGADEILTFGRYIEAMLHQMPVHTSDLCYSASRLTQALGTPRLIGPFLKIALQRVQDGNLANDEEAITAAANKWAKRRQTKDI
ncbi:MAG: CCA tRNA nucleotidyltransferase [Veillonellaceae bacterium]|nr:CCA tRNA nucleotidyltransferase [Veillonellaceae bacterium]